MDVEKRLGKIERVSFGRVNDMPFLMGLQLSLTGIGWGVSSHEYLVNISPNCKWTAEERMNAISELMDKIASLLDDAKVFTVDKLMGKPVEVTFDSSHTIKEFRILTEVL